MCFLFENSSKKRRKKQKQTKKTKIHRQKREKRCFFAFLDLVKFDLKTEKIGKNRKQKRNQSKKNAETKTNRKKKKENRVFLQQCVGFAQFDAL